jgi:hypothetical protein
MSLELARHHQGGPGAFVGRKRELGELEAGMESAIAGQGGLFLVPGDAGVGKTCLAEELASRAAARNVLPLWSRAWEGEGAPSFWQWVQIVPEVPSWLPDVPAPPTPLESDSSRFQEPAPDLRPRRPAGLCRGGTLVGRSPRPDCASGPEAARGPPVGRHDPDGRLGRSPCDASRRQEPALPRRPAATSGPERPEHGPRSRARGRRSTACRRRVRVRTHGRANRTPRECVERELAGEWRGRRPGWTPASSVATSIRYRWAARSAGKGERS